MNPYQTQVAESIVCTGKQVNGDYHHANFKICDHKKINCTEEKCMLRICRQLGNTLLPSKFDTHCSGSNIRILDKTMVIDHHVNN